MSREPKPFFQWSPKLKSDLIKPGLKSLLTCAKCHAIVDLFTPKYRVPTWSASPVQPTGALNNCCGNSCHVSQGKQRVPYMCSTIMSGELCPPQHGWWCFPLLLMIPVQAPVRAVSLVIVSKVKCAFIKMIWTTSCPCITVEKFGWWSDFSRWLACVWTDRGSFAANQTVLIGALLQQQEREALCLCVLILLSSKLFLPYNSFGCRWM